jgi:hypothetical protein
MLFANTGKNQGTALAMMRIFGNNLMQSLQVHGCFGGLSDIFSSGKIDILLVPVEIGFPA